MSAGQPDLKFDIDALFAHLLKLDGTVSEPKNWVFMFRADKPASLKKLSRELEGEYPVSIEDVECVDGDTGTSRMEPYVCVQFEDVLTPARVKELAAAFAQAARDHGAIYEGVRTYDVVDEEEMFRWLDRDEAIWRLRHFTDNGLPEGEEAVFLFAFTAEREAAIEKLAGLLESRGYDDAETGEGDDGEPMLVLHAPGANDDDLLRSRYGEMERAAAEAGATLLGVQFGSADEQDEDEDF